MNDCVVKVFTKAGGKIVMDLSTWLELPWPRSLFVDPNGYAVMKVYCDPIRREESVSLHRWINYNPKNRVVDHINGVRSDCRKENLRVCTQSQNCLNRKGVTLNSKGKKPHSKYKGVTFRPERNKWVPRIGIPGEFYSSGRQKIKHLGHFKTQEEAAKAYNEAVLKYYGEFGYLNKVA